MNCATQSAGSPLSIPVSPPAEASEPFAEASAASAGTDLAAYFDTLAKALGSMHWWPARTPFEVIVGAILVQNTAWSNVARAIANLRREKLLTPRAMERLPLARLSRLVRSSGCFRQKARKLKSFLRFLRHTYGGSLKRMFRTPTLELRAQLLAVHGIGPETADSILLYAGAHPVFVVDAYTHRILERHGLHAGKPDYERLRALFESRLPRDARVYNEFHALLVNVGKRWCRTRNPRCEECPLRVHLPAATPFAAAAQPGISARNFTPIFESAVSLPPVAARPTWSPHS
jgi:endonuclease III related protein